ncbi:putative alpha-amylase precursor [Naematelia encephala]|uniref:Alpha-amylase n=1 Tax=Naematelia encephala TaxID=71784 RepID=A0A1Y2BL81_9TREE|nr:putative alpha-amylase precursor [Naematelia encephala]
MRSRTVYQLVTDRFARSSSTTSTCDPGAREYCGGTWSDISSQLSYIRGMGFDTIWVSPIVANIGGTTGEGEAYHGYWTLNPEQLNSNFGSETDLQSLASAVHAAGMYLIVDVVINHVAATSSSTFSPSDSYGPFSASDDFHKFCWIDDYSNQTDVEQCWLGDTSVALPDLDTESSVVIDYWNTWITSLVSNYSIDAIRIDTVKHIRQTFWPGFASAAGVYCVGEVLDGDATYVSSYQNTSVNPFNYPIFYPLVRAFNSTSGNIGDLVTMAASVKSSFQDPTLLGSFLNNHDNPRFENYTSDQALIMNAHAYPFVTDGITFAYYGSEAGFSGGNDPYNREPLWTSNYDTSSTMYQYFASLNAARSAAGNASSTFYTNQMTLSQPSDSVLQIVKSPLISLLTNVGSSGSASSVSISSSTSSWSANQVIVDAVTCTTLTTDSSGNLAVAFDSGKPRVLIADSQKGSLCANGTSTSTSSATTSASTSTSTSTSKSAGERSVDAKWALCLLGLASVFVL